MQKNKPKIALPKNSEKLQPSKPVQPPESVSLLKKLTIPYRYSLTINDSKTLFFKLGTNKAYTSSIYVYKHHKEESPIFYDLAGPIEEFPCNITFADSLMEITKHAFEDLKKVGWIIAHKTLWGFLLDLSTLEPIYKGEIPSHWRNLLKYNFFAEEFIKYAYYNYDAVEQNANNNIPSTEFDAPIRAAFCPIYNALFFHQKREVGWMFELECHPKLLIPSYMKSIPFLDTGFFINSTSKNISYQAEDSGINADIPAGILASQIGSGKTVSMIGLMSIGSQFDKDIRCKSPGKETRKRHENYSKNKLNQEEHKGEYIDQDNYDELRVILKDTYDPSFVIVTKNILYQWKQETEKFAPHLKVFFWENLEDILDVKFHQETQTGEAYTNYDIILTHRKILDVEPSSLRSLCPLLFEVRFRRIIIDEIHELVSAWTENSNLTTNMKDKKSKDSAQEELNMPNLFANLQSIKRFFTWGMTGTPNNLNFHNQAGTLFKMLNLAAEFGQLNVYQEFKNKFLKHHVRANPCHLNLPALLKSSVEVAFGTLQNLIYQVKLTYAMNIEEARVACSQILPQYDIISEKEEKELAELSLHHAMAAIYQKHQNQIENINYRFSKNPNDKSLQNRLKSLLDENNFYLEMIELLKQETIPCPICISDVGIDELVVTNCVHSLCKTCYVGLNKTFGHVACPICRNIVLQTQLILHPNFANNKSNKLKEILREIKNVPQDDKIIIFTQFHSLVDKLEKAFTQLGLNYMVLKGQPSEINIGLRKFENVPEIKILLMSVEQAASGINITVANHIFFAHPIFGDSVERTALTYNQCIGRAYRIGQMKPVFVKLFVTCGSLEEPMQHTFMNSTRMLV